MGKERWCDAPEDFPHMDVRPRFLVRRSVMLWAGVLCGLGSLLAPGNVQAQQASVSGFATDVTDGQPLELVNVVLEQDGLLVRGAAAPV